MRGERAHRGEGVRVSRRTGPLPGALVLAAWLAGVAAVAAGCPTPCSPSTCEGCCTAEGACATGASKFECGLGGAACAPCASKESCRLGVCLAPDGGLDAGPPCGCLRGCCLGDGGCAPGNLPEVCGLADRACRACAAPERCDRGVCTTNPCYGCFDPTGQCLVGTAATACGLGGSICVGCLTGERCESGACVARPCNSTTCATGCCTLDARCVATPTNSQCGSLGSDCLACVSGTTCKLGVCSP